MASHGLQYASNPRAHNATGHFANELMSHIPNSALYLLKRARDATPAMGAHLRELDEAADVRRGGGLAIRHVDQVAPVLQHRAQRAHEPGPALHAAQPRVADLA